MLIEQFKYLPEDLIPHIVGYIDEIVYRNGKYINRLQKNDIRYRMLLKIPKPIKVGSNRVLIRLLDMREVNRPGYFLEYIIGICRKVNIKFVTHEIDGFDRYIETKFFLQYIFE
jgi:hypothetical protein